MYARPLITRLDIGYKIREQKYFFILLKKNNSSFKSLNIKVQAYLTLI